MKRTTQPRATVNLSKSVQHQLNMYALAASATGVALLAAAQPVNAKIVYTPAHQQLINHKPFDLDLDHNGVKLVFHHIRQEDPHSPGGTATQQDLVVLFRFRSSALRRSPAQGNTNWTKGPLFHEPCLDVLHLSW
jgi:hypothetical protein